MKRRRNALLPMILAGGLAGLPAWCHAADAADWSYTGPKGPARWGKLDKSYALCAQGSAQSPIDIPDASVRKGDLPPILFNYRPSSLKIVDDGRTIRVDYAPDSWITVAGRRYELVGFSFRKPSEHKIDRKGFDMEVQLLHKDKEGKLAVVAVLLEQGKENALVKTLWTHLPLAKGKQSVVDAVKINAVGLLPPSKDYYHLRRLAVDAALHRRRHLDAAPDAGAGVDRADRALRPELSDERAARAAAERPRPAGKSLSARGQPARWPGAHARGRRDAGPGRVASSRAYPVSCGEVSITTAGVNASTTACPGRSSRCQPPGSRMKSDGSFSSVIQTRPCGT